MNSQARIESKDISITLIVSAFVLQIFFFAPLQALAQNFGEFSVLFTDVLLSLLLVSVILVVFLGFILQQLRSPILLSVLTLLSVIGFIESRFLLSFARHNPFDGKLIDWAALGWLSYLELGVFIVVGVLFIIIRKRTQILSTVSLFILLFLTVGLIHGIYSNYGSLKSDPQNNVRTSLYLDQFYRLSTNRNVIHIVPDQAQGAMLHEILTSDLEHYSKAFDGFTFFTQAVGRYKGTYPSVVYYMTGESFEPEADIVKSQPFSWEYIEETLKERSIVTLLAENGFNTFGFQFHPGIYCKGRYTACTGTHDEVFAGIAANNPKRKLALTVLTAVDLGLFQMSPVVLRQQVYDDGRWFVRKLLTGAVSHSGILDVFIEKMQAGANPDSYNYFHHAGAHAPLIFDRNCNYVGPQPVDFANEGEQARCTLIQLEKMIQALKKSGVYDQTMIVVNGDHGTPWLPSSFSGQSGEIVPDYLMGMASVFLFIKPPAARGPMGFSDQAVTMGDIPATIAGVYGLDHAYSGVQIFNEEPVAGRERYYFNYDSSSTAHSLQALENLTRYRIRGNVFDERDWVLPGMQSVAGSPAESAVISSGATEQSLNAGKYPAQLKMDHARFEVISQGFSWLEQHSVPVRWVDGTTARVFLSPPSQDPISLVFKSYVPPLISGQSMEISINGRVIAKLTEEVLKGSRHTVSIPDDLLPAEEFDIEFKMAKTTSTPQDPRLLSVLFSYIGLEPAE